MPHDQTAVVQRLGASGDGVVETAAGQLFVPGALPGETIAFGGDASPAIVGEPSPDRRALPLCPHVERCGGCALQHLSDDLYRAWKPTVLTSALRQHGFDITPEPMRWVPLASRRRAVLTAIRNDDGAEIGFRGRRSHRLEPITRCAVLVPAIVEALPGLAAIAALVLAPGGETHVTVAATPDGIDAAFESGRKSIPPGDLERALRIAAANRIARLTLAGAPLGVRAAPRVDVAGIKVALPPGAFLQAALAAETTLQDLVAAGIGKSRAVADLFAGLGTFTLPLARKARVLAIDSDRALITALAEAHRHTSGLKPLETRIRDLFLDPLSPRELEAFDAVVFDPPRAGAKAQAASLARSKVKAVVAVSCNPATLARDLRTLVDGGYRLERVTPVDQFLFTPHLEAVAVLRRR